MKTGVQLFGPLRNRKGTVLENLTQLAEAGITRIEPCLSLEPIPGFEAVIWPINWLMENLEEIKALGLQIISAHVFGSHLVSSAGKLKKVAEAAGLLAYVVKTPREITDISLHQAAMNYQKLADELAVSGTELWLHNEAEDIQTSIHGKTAYEYLLDLCQGKVYAQVDAGWVLAAGEDPEAFLKRNASRVHALHYKDFDLSVSKKTDVPVGKGSLAISPLVAFAKAKDLPQIIDQENFTEPVKELKEALNKLEDVKFDWSHTASFLDVYDIETGEVTTLARFDIPMESPNWLKNSSRMLLDGGGKLYFYHMDTGETTLIDTGFCTNCGNAHVPSPDETRFAVSHGGWGAQAYIFPIDGGEPRQATRFAPSFFHGWTPDGKNLLYLGSRGQDGLDIYRCAADASEEEWEEVQLTFGGYNDGPEYSPDGQYIWYNSNISGSAQIWRMKADGSEKTQITQDDRTHMFPHISPDGTKVVYTVYPEKWLKQTEHVPNVPIEFWLMNADGTDQHKILSFFGGHGAMHVNGWSPDSKKFAFISYEKN